MAKLIEIFKSPRLWIALIALIGYGSVDQFTEEHPPIVIHVEHTHDDLEKRVEYLEGLDEHVH